MGRRGSEGRRGVGMLVLGTERRIAIYKVGTARGDGGIKR